MMTFLISDRIQKKGLLLFLSLLLSLWLCFAPGICQASGTPEPVVYQITETELVTLENNLAQLRSINETLQRELAAQQRELHVLKEESSRLVRQLNELKSGSQKQEELLMKANKSLEEYATEAKKERLRIKAQRNTWEAVAAMAVIAFAVKK